jgi:hypothetical protein
VFVLFTLVALVDGLVRLDLRRWGGGRESSFVYHYAKQPVLPLVALAWAPCVRVVVASSGSLG